MPPPQNHFSISIILSDVLSFWGSMWVSFPPVGASHPGFMVSRAHYSGKDALNIHWDRYYLEEYLLATPQPQNHYLLVLYWVLFCLLGFYVATTACSTAQPSSGNKSPKASWWAEPIILGTIYKTFTTVHLMDKTSYRPYPSPRTNIYWYCTECCSVFVGFYVNKCLLKCPALKWEQVTQAPWWVELFILGKMH